MWTYISALYSDFTILTLFDILYLNILVFMILTCMNELPNELQTLFEVNSVNNQMRNQYYFKKKRIKYFL